MLKAIEDNDYIAFSSSLGAISHSKIENSSIERLLDASGKKELSPIFLKKVLELVHQARPELHLNEFLSVGKPFKSPDVGMIQLPGISILLNNSRPKVADPDFRFAVTYFPEQTIKDILEQKGDLKTGVFFNFRHLQRTFKQPMGSFHTSFVYIQRKGDDCTIALIDSTDSTEYRKPIETMVKSRSLSNCKVRFISARRQVDSTSCATFCVHDFMTIQKNQEKFNEFYQEAEDKKIAKRSETSLFMGSPCYDHTLFPPAMMKLAQSFDKILEPYQQSMDDEADTISSPTSEDIDDLRVNLERNARKFSGKELRSSTLSQIRNDFPSLSSVYYNEKNERMINVATKSKTSKYIGVIVKTLLSMPDLKREEAIRQARLLYEGK